MKNNKLEYIVGHNAYDKWKMVDAFLDVTYSALTFDPNGHKIRVMQELRKRYKDRYDIHFTIEFVNIPKYDKHYRLLDQFLCIDVWGLEGWKVIKDVYIKSQSFSPLVSNYEEWDDHEINLHDLKELLKLLEQEKVSNILSPDQLRYKEELKAMIANAEA